ncbi:MAG: N-6 DNA methylase [Candidatus Margulisbacteria bacterium]|nr:N-6 DNA methylase [Candidatus Margulisiibacteriota bacterium]
MPIKKSQLYSSIWEACDQLRGGMDASQYKDYVLVLLFVKYISDKYAEQRNPPVVIPKGGSFADMISLKGNKDIGEGINKILSKLAEANGLKDVIDAVDFNNEDKLGKGKEMQDRLSDLVAIFENPELEFGKNRAEGDDLLGDAYEYLMKHFAVDSGKSKGQFYTPAEVSRIIAKVIGANKSTGMMQTVYDPTCGSGSLLLKIAAETPKGISIYGQEKESFNANIAILNMWLHGNSAAVIKKGNTLTSPEFIYNGSLKTFDYVIANPPFSDKKWRTGFDPEHDQYDRFTGFGIPPKKNGDYAFLLHIVRSLKSTGKGAVILPHGVLFRGHVEGKIRKNIIQRGYIKGIVGLPANLFYGTGIPACIIVLDKEGAESRKGIFMIDASKGFIKDGSKNRLREQDIKKIVDVFNGQTEIPKYSRFILYKEIQKHEYNLNLPRYIDTQETEDLQDIEAHLKGGIPNADIDALNNYWKVCPALKGKLFVAFKRRGYSKLAIKPENIKKTILSHPEYEAFRKTKLKIFTSWKSKTLSVLKNISTKDHPKAIIASIADDLLVAFAGTSLIDKYDIYQHLMTYWGETMQDDAYILTTEGWKAGNVAMRLQKESKGKKKDIAGLPGLEGRLIPVSLIINTYFSAELSRLDGLNADIEQVEAQMNELKDKHGGEEGLLSEVIENDKVVKGAIQKRIKEIKKDADYADELKVLEQYAALFEKQADVKNKIKEAEKDLEKKVLIKYPKLTLKEIKILVVERKWMSALESAIQNEVDRRSQILTGRIKELTERYETTLPELTNSVDELAAKVHGHLNKMGVKI